MFLRGVRRLCPVCVPDPEFHYSLVHRKNAMFFLYFFIILAGILLSETQSRDTKFCTIQNTMKLCAPLEVKGVQGEDVIIPCRFSHNEGSNIKQLSLVFKKYHYNQYVIFRSSTNYTHSSFEGRIQTVGNPSEGDGSVRIRDLKMEDEGTYGCRFEFAKWYSGWGPWYRVGFEQRSEKRTKVQIDGSHIHETYNCTMEGTKKLCVQREVMGVRGEDVILPCRFNHSKGNNITNLNLVLYKYFSSGHNVVIFNSFNNDTDGGFNGRIQTVGSLSEGDGSVRIRYLKIEDEGTYRCRFEFDEWRSSLSSWHHGVLEARKGKETTVRVDGSHIHETYNCTMEGTKKLCVQREVMGVRGEDVILPCRFKHSKGNNITNLNLVLSKYFSSGHNVVIFNNFNNDTDGGFNGRIQTVGSLSEGDGSVRIRYLKIEDEGTYRCRFEFDEWRSSLSSWHHGALEARKGKETTVRVDVQPKILDISKEFVNSSNSWRVICEGEAKPGPNITWLNPKGLPVNGAKIASSPNGKNGLQNITSTFTITGEDPEGQYTCLVKNKYGMAQDHVIHLTNTGKQWIVIGCSIALSLVLLLLFAVGLHIYRKKRNPREGTERGGLVHGSEEEASRRVPASVVR
uniref:CD276 antigen-like isoform X2 n=1 Tax=Myxine glutinosa TaxID=7769 RepID=UPI00358F7EF9